MLFLSLIVCSCEREGGEEVEGMVHVPPGKFYMGSRGSVERHGADEGDGKVGIEVGVDEIPGHTVALKGFYIDMHEVTNSLYKKFIDATGHRPPDNPGHPYDPYIWKDGTYPPAADENPVVLVSYDDAIAYCRWRGKRLPTEAEWEKACRGEDGRRRPWGDDAQPSWANLRQLELRRTTPVGSFPSDLSPYGAYDMSGNAREWTSSWYESYPGSTLERKFFGKEFKVLKGGSWLHFETPEGRCPSRGFALPETRHRSAGFRCAKDG